MSKKKKLADKEVPKKLEYKILYEKKGIDIAIKTNNKQIDEDRLLAYVLVCMDITQVLNSNTPLPIEVRMEFLSILDSLTGCSEAIKAKIEKAAGYKIAKKDEVDLRELKKILEEKLRQHWPNATIDFGEKSVKKIPLKKEKKNGNKKKEPVEKNNKSSDEIHL